MRDPLLIRGCHADRNEALLKRRPSSDLKKKKDTSPYRSGVVPYMVEEGSGELLIMLVTPRKGGKWILPKGNIARGMDSIRSAEKEACEEAGVLGNVHRVLLGIQGSANHQLIEIYPLEITKILPEWEESAVRSRLFFTLEEAYRELNTNDCSAILDALSEYVSERKNEAEQK